MIPLWPSTMSPPLVALMIQSLLHHSSEVVLLIRNLVIKNGVVSNSKPGNLPYLTASKAPWYSIVLSPDNV